MPWWQLSNSCTCKTRKVVIGEWHISTIGKPRFCCRGSWHSCTLPNRREKRVAGQRRTNVPFGNHTDVSSRLKTIATVKSILLTLNFFWWFQQVAHPYFAIPVLACQSFQSHCFESRSLSVLESYFCSPLVTASWRHFLRPVGSSLLADVCLHFTLAFSFLSLWRPCPSPWRLAWVGNLIPAGQIWQCNFLFFILFTLGVLLGIVLGMPRGPTPVPGMMAAFLAYPSKNCSRHGSQHALAKERDTNHSRNLHNRRTGVSQSEPEDARARPFCVMERSRRKWADLLVEALRPRPKVCYSEDAWQIWTGLKLNGERHT